MSERPAVKRHHGVVRLTHWLTAVLLTGMIASGLQIYGAFPRFGPREAPYPLPNPWAVDRPCPRRAPYTRSAIPRGPSWISFNC